MPDSKINGTFEKKESQYSEFSYQIQIFIFSDLPEYSILTYNFK